METNEVVLTPRQQETLDLMARGYSNTRIATQMGISTRCVENYINTIYAEMNLDETDGIHPRVTAVLKHLGGC